MIHAYFIIFLLVTSVSANDRCSPDNPGVKLTLYESLFYDFVKITRWRTSTPREAQMIAHSNPISLYLINKDVDLATQHSQIYCRSKWIDKAAQKKDTEDNEIDAIRHFVMATMLAYFYPDKAMSILFNHEISGTKPLNAQNLMDIHNNREGMDFGDSLRAQKSKLSRNAVALLAVEKAAYLLQKNKLRILKTAVAGPCQNFSSKSLAQVKGLVEDHIKDFDSRKRACLGSGFECGIE